MWGGYSQLFHSVFPSLLLTTAHMAFWLRRPCELQNSLWGGWKGTLLFSAAEQLVGSRPGGHMCDKRTEAELHYVYADLKQSMKERGGLGKRKWSG